MKVMGDGGFLSLEALRGVTWFSIPLHDITK
jgi:hypothetical protein